MAKFDVYRNAEVEGYLLDYQANLLASLNTRFVVPLLPLDAVPTPAGRLNPVFEIAGIKHSMVTQFAAAVPVNLLREKVASLGADEIAIGNAIDMLLAGY